MSSKPCPNGCGRICDRRVNGCRGCRWQKWDARDIADRLLERVERNGDCWLRQGRCTAAGYAQLRVLRRLVYAHRAAYERWNGPIAPGLSVCHSCDVNYPTGDITYRRCINPAHLFLGTQVENVQDMNGKGRGARGERNGVSKLTAAQVAEIRALAASGGLSQETIGLQFGVTQSNVSTIHLRKSWADDVA